MNHRMPAVPPPHDYFRIKVVGSFEELVNTRFGDGVNALCWERELPGNYAEIVEQLGVVDGLIGLDETILNGLKLSPDGRVAADQMLEDRALLAARGLAPVLDCIGAYPRDEPEEVVPTHVYSFHADSAPVEADTYLCTYFGAASEGLRNEEAIRRVDVPEIRGALREAFGELDDEAFLEVLSEHCYDLHYEPRPGAHPYGFGIGNLWRIAIQYPGCPVPPCIHRAPDNVAGDLPRLLLIS